MLLIFDLHGGFTDMLKDLVSIHNFTIKYKYYFTIRHATSRPINNPTSFTNYPIHNLINTKSFRCNKFYVEYQTIRHLTNKRNTYDFHKYHVNNKLWKNDNFLKESDVINAIKNTNTQFFIIGGSFWYYSKLWNYNQVAVILSHLIPSDKIVSEYNKYKIHGEYNCIHYRYENDWITTAKKNNTPYIVPPLDELLNNLQFTQKHSIYICTSNIQNLHSIGLLKNKLESYTNIIYKQPNDLNYDENGFLDLLIASNSTEFYGNSISGFSLLLSTIKKTSNFYDKIEYFTKYNIIK
jgi:hypothetical protein